MSQSNILKFLRITAVPRRQLQPQPFPKVYQRQIPQHYHRHYQAKSHIEPVQPDPVNPWCLHKDEERRDDVADERDAND